MNPRELAQWMYRADKVLLRSWGWSLDEQGGGSAIIGSKVMV